MKNLLILSLLIFTLAGVKAQTTSKSKKKTEALTQKKPLVKAPESKVEKLSYSIGLNFARQFKSQNIEINPDFLYEAIKTVMSDGIPAMTDEQAMNTLQEFEKEMQDRMKSDMKNKAKDNIEKCRAWLAENKKRPGVTELPSGLQYEIITPGTGESPKADSKVTTHYVGTLIDGTEFDSSVKRGQPATFALNSVIKGWTEALQLMKTGAKWKLFIPSDLAYGDAGSPPNIGPGETLIFEIELISVQN
jgi:FKBP-type peptidyl-prolyl cis-trans isomerase FklB